MKSLLLIMSLLTLLLHEAQGLHEAKESILVEDHENIPSSVAEKRNNGGVEDAFENKIRHYSGRNRKLMIKKSTAVSDNRTMFKKDEHDRPKSRNEKISGREENLHMKSSSTTGKQQHVKEPYPDILDIAGMDYSQARRKPPIHN